MSILQRERSHGMWRQKKDLFRCHEEFLTSMNIPVGSWHNSCCFHYSFETHIFWVKKNRQNLWLCLFIKCVSSNETSSMKHTLFSTYITMLCYTHEECQLTRRTSIHLFKKVNYAFLLIAAVLWWFVFAYLIVPDWQQVDRNSWLRCFMYCIQKQLSSIFPDYIHE
jgi:hypothetical protein